MKSAEQSGKLVSQLYPKDVREKLYQEQEMENKMRDSDDGFQVDHGRVSTALGPKTAIASLYPDTTIIFADLVGKSSRLFSESEPMLPISNLVVLLTFL